MNTELYIEGYRLDLTSDIDALLNFSIDDVKEFSARSTTWSKTIVLPGTANNNRLFGHIFQVGQSNNYDGSQPNVGYNFNASKAANVILFQDQIQAFKGVLRLMQINISDGFQGKVEYEVSVFGNLVGLNAALSGALLENLDFSAYNHIYNDSNIVASWDNPGGTGYYYPLIDYGTYSTLKHDWDIHTFRPALYVREYVEKIFSTAGYRWQAPLFDTPRFKSLVIPHSKKIMTVNQSTLGVGTITTTKSYTFAHTGDDDKLLTWDSIIGTGFSLDTNKQVFTYNGTVTTNIIIEGGIDVNFTGVAFFYSVVLYVYKNGKTGTLLYNPVTIFSPTTIQININTSMAPGDTIEFWFNGTADSLNVTAASVKFRTASGTAAVPISIGDSVNVNEYIPQNIRQIDFLVGIIKLWNLYVYEDKNDPFLIWITPYIDFYSRNFSNSVDWTHKLNRNKITKVKPMSELNAKIYKFKFKSDSDYYNELYRKRYNEGYGDRVYDSEFEFTQQTSEFEICFSGTPIVGYGGEDKIYSTILKQTGNAPDITEENVDSNIRILQTKKVTGVTAWAIKNGDTVLNTLTKYGYAGHLDDPDIPTNDLNFGATKELFFLLTAGSLSNNQFNAYWSGYMREITDKDSKLVTANFYLTTQDILNLDFSKYIYVDGIAFRLNSIKDYNLTTPSDCEVELLKVNAASYTEAASNSGPPAGCYLLWSDDNTLDADDSNTLLYGDCATNPGDGGGGPPSPVVHKLNWSWQRIGLLSTGSIKIYVDDVLTISSTLTNASGVFDLQDGQDIRIEVSSFVNRQKRIFVSNSIDGVMYDQTTTGTPVHSYTFTVESGKDYTVIGSVQTS